MPAHRRGPWSQSEDQTLMLLVGRQGASNWVRISQMIQTRSPKQCRERYHQNLKPNLNHSPITAEEGRQIEELVNTMGKRWAEIARRLPGRSDNAVKNWWNGGQNRRRRAGGRPRDGCSPERNHVFGGVNLPYVRPHDAYVLPPPLSLPNPAPTYERTNPLESPNSYSQPTGYSHAKARPEPLDLGVGPAPSGLYSPRHYGYPTPLPSPSGQSNASTETPSLVSDSSLNVSPLTPIGLPPLIGDRDERRNSQIAWLPANTTGFVGSDGHFESVPRPDAKQGPTYHVAPPTFREPQWQPRKDSPVQTQQQEFGSVLSQRSLPAYESIQLGIPALQSLLPSQAPSPQNSCRVGISSMLNGNDERPGSRSYPSSSRPTSPASISAQSASPPRSSKMDITSLI